MFAHEMFNFRLFRGGFPPLHPSTPAGRSSLYRGDGLGVNTSRARSFKAISLSSDVLQNLSLSAVLQTSCGSLPSFSSHLEFPGAILAPPPPGWRTDPRRVPAKTSGVSNRSSPSAASKKSQVLALNHRSRPVRERCPTFFGISR